MRTEKRKAPRIGKHEHEERNKGEEFLPRMTQRGKAATKRGQKRRQTECH
jgi:hypothetical protein